MARMHQHATITITGTNDGATIAGTASDTVQEDVDVSGKPDAGGELTVTDVDSGESGFQPQAAAAATATARSARGGGHWTYTADNGQAAIGLAVDECLTDSFTAVSADHGETVTVTINGSNDIVYTADDTVDPSDRRRPAVLMVGSRNPSTHFGQRPRPMSAWSSACR